MLAIVCILIAISALSYSTYLHFRPVRTISAAEKERRFFREQMELLGLEDHEIDVAMHEYKSIWELKEANKKLKKSLRKFNRP
jgi:hypothetical protein